MNPGNFTMLEADPESILTCSEAQVSTNIPDSQSREALLANSHIENGTPLNPDLLSVWKKIWKGLRWEAAKEEMTERKDISLYFLYGPDFDSFPLPKSLFSASEELLRAIYCEWKPYFRSLIADRQEFQDVAEPGVLFREHMRITPFEQIVHSVQAELSPRYCCGLLREEQAMIVCRIYQRKVDILRLYTEKAAGEWRREDFTMLGLEMSILCTALRIACIMRSERFEKVLLGYILEEGVFEAVVEGVERASLSHPKYLQV
ncbi:hypothetical protein BJ508DRAFT_311430 [Ascobolus immersus RN42]|uniref:Uncharacterized protein n=1 Tax=Ascobolus immersus RN42 TaxID=1160509 RepID=A0A3N4I2B4_ASCIM|nr:hypothetical protein BJ508DRAFT_311430 [Ascobolus immersus RN42]